MLPRGRFRSLRSGVFLRSESDDPLCSKASEADAAASTIRAELDASISEAGRLATGLREREQEVAARDLLLREAREASELSRGRFERAREEAEASSRKASEAEAAAATERGEGLVDRPPRGR